MADTVNTNVLVTGGKRRVVQLQNISDGTGESGVVKVDVSALLKSDGTAPTYVSIEEVEWSIQGFTSVRLHFDANTDDEGVLLAAGNGYKNFRAVGGVVDPKSTGTTGDIKLTTAGAVSGGTYDIVLSVRLK